MQNRLYKLFLVGLAVIGCGQFTNAQDTTKKKSVNITSTFKPVLKESAKINFAAAPPTSDTTRPKLNYDIPDQNLLFPYQPGTLKAFGLKNNKAVDSVVLQTPGKAAKIRLTADRSLIKNSRNDLAYVTVEIVDADGRLIPDASIPLQFSIEGNGEITATASASPDDMQSFQKPEHRTFRGKCLVIVRPKDNGGKIILQAKGGGLAGGQIVIEAK